MAVMCMRGAQTVSVNQRERHAGSSIWLEQSKAPKGHKSLELECKKGEI